MKNYSTAEKLISAAGTAVLCTVFALWCADYAGSPWGCAAAALSAVLMLALCLLFVPTWFAFWREPEHTLPDSEGEGGVCIRIFALILLWDMLILLLGYLLRALLGFEETAGEYISFWLCTDSRHYMDIAREGYLSAGQWDRLVQLVFLPGYPVPVRLLSIFTGNCLTAGLALSALCFAGSGAVLYKLARLDMDKRAAMCTVSFFALSPAAFFFAAPMSESLFVLCTVSSLYFLRKNRLLACGALAAYAAFTRSPGLIIMVPMLFELVHRRAKLRQYLVLFSAPIGFAAYCLINFAVSGDAFKFMEYQSVHWGQQLGWFFNTAAYQTENAIASAQGNIQNLLGLWLPNLAAQLIGLAAVILATRRLRASYTAYFAAYFIVTVGATWLLSAPRYLAAMITLPMALALLCRTKKGYCLLTAISLAAFLGYFTAFLLRWQVW